MTETGNAEMMASENNLAEASPSPAPSTLRHDANDLPWPHRPWLMAILCAVAGIIFFLLVDDHSGDPSPLRQALAVFVAVSTIAFVLTVELRRWQWSAIFAVAWGVIIAGVGFYTAQYNQNGEIVEFPFFAGIFAVLLAAPLFQSARDVGSRHFSYARSHNHIWNDAVIGAAAIAFTGISFLLMFLLASLFNLVGIDFLERLMGEEEFIFAVAGAAFGGAVGILRERDALVSTMQRLVMVVLSVLAPVLAVGLAIFLVSLPFTGLQPLWDSTKATTPILLFCAAGAFILANVVIGNGAEDRFDNRILQKAALVLALCMLPLAIIAAISMGLRIQQYGWTPSRIWGMLVVVVALAYGLSYYWAIFKGRGNWEALARQWNLRGAIALVAIAVFLALPIVDFGSISAKDQLARLKSGKTPVHKFDWAAMAYDFGPKGREIVKNLASDPNIEIAMEAKETLKANNRWDVTHNDYDEGQDDQPLAKRLVLSGMASSAADKEEVIKAMRDKQMCRFGPCVAKKLDEKRWLISGSDEKDSEPNMSVLTRANRTNQDGSDASAQDVYWSEQRLSFDFPDPLTAEQAHKESSPVTGNAGTAVVEWKPVPQHQLYINGEPTGHYIDE